MREKTTHLINVIIKITVAALDLIIYQFMGF